MLHFAPINGTTWSLRKGPATAAGPESPKGVKTMLCVFMLVDIVGLAFGQVIQRFRTFQLKGHPETDGSEYRMLQHKARMSLRTMKVPRCSELQQKHICSAHVLITTFVTSFGHAHHHARVALRLRGVGILLCPFVLRERTSGASDPVIDCTRGFPPAAGQKPSYLPAIACRSQKTRRKPRCCFL